MSRTTGHVKNVELNQPNSKESPLPQPGSAMGRVVRPAETFKGKQELLYNVGISAETVGARGIHMQLVTIPPGARAKAHKHEAHETAIYALQGESGVWHGPRLEHHSVVKSGDFFYIPANVPHVPYNPSETEAVVVVIARTDPNEQESVALLPALDELPLQHTEHNGTSPASS